MNAKPCELKLFRPFYLGKLMMVSGAFLGGVFSYRVNGLILFGLMFLGYRVVVRRYDFPLLRDLVTMAGINALIGNLIGSVFNAFILMELGDYTNQNLLPTPLYAFKMGPEYYLPAAIALIGLGLCILTKTRSDTFCNRRLLGRLVEYFSILSNSYKEGASNNRYQPDKLKRKSSMVVVRPWVTYKTAGTVSFTQTEAFLEYLVPNDHRLRMAHVLWGELPRKISTSQAAFVVLITRPDFICDYAEDQWIEHGLQYFSQTQETALYSYLLERMALLIDDNPHSWAHLPSAERLREMGRPWQDDVKGNTINHNTNALIALDPR